MTITLAYGSGRRPGLPPTKLVALVDPSTRIVVGLTTDVEDAPDLGQVVERISFSLNCSVHIGQPCPLFNHLKD